MENFETQVIGLQAIPVKKTRLMNYLQGVVEKFIYIINCVVYLGLINPNPNGDNK